MITLVPITETEFKTYWEQDIIRYAEENVRAGYWNASEALDKSRAAHSNLLPNGLVTPNHYLFSIRESNLGEKVGTLWLARDPDYATPSGFIYDLFILEPFRRKGFATEAMRALEGKAGELGIKALYLQVFAHNRVARSLYDRLGYRAASTRMVKKLAAGDRE